LFIFYAVAVCFNFTRTIVDVFGVWKNVGNKMVLVELLNCGIIKFLKYEEETTTRLLKLI